MDVKFCKYCVKPEDKQDSPGLQCSQCQAFVHLHCLRRSSTPGDITGDAFFNFICEICSQTGQEIITRSRVPWVNIVILTINHLNRNGNGISNHGFFHYKTHICHYIDKNWNLLFGNQVKQKKNWIGTIAGVLSHYNNTFFLSGLNILGEPGWWKLMHKFSPDVSALILQEMAKDKTKSKMKKSDLNEGNSFLEKVTELGFNHLLATEDELVSLERNFVAKKNTALEYASSTSRLQFCDSFTSDSRSESLVDDPDEESSSMWNDMYDATGLRTVQTSETSSMHSFPPQISHMRGGSNSESRSPLPLPALPPSPPPDFASSENEEKPRAVSKAIKKDLRPKSNPFTIYENSVDLMPWLKKDVREVPKTKLLHMSEYEEIQLLKRVEALAARTCEPGKRAELRRLRAKLSVRRLKRHHRLPLFDLHTTLQNVCGTSVDVNKKLQNTRILDRYQSNSVDKLSGTVRREYITIPTLLAPMEPKPIVSPYNPRAFIKPYIRRDYDSRPLRLRLLDELLQRTHRHEPGFALPDRAPIDYAYVQPGHIAAVNNLCAHFFWNGIDISESLQYPEFSCVVSYKKLVVGFAFLVPDVRHNEAYITFIFTLPQWRSAKIATFMLYHLLQTCVGKDVTLHVSPSNSAIFLYQKFGFKIEELIQDFYDKYYDIDSKVCKHAVFLRLAR